MVAIGYNLVVAPVVVKAVVAAVAVIAKVSDLRSSQVSGC